MKTYRQFCGVAKALDVLGERWTLLLVRDLILGPRRFSDFEHGLPGITPNLLTKRLAHLRDHGLVELVPAPGQPSAKAYALTEAGRDLEPIVLSLGTFGARYLTHPQSDERMDPRHAMLSLKRRYVGSRLSGTASLQVGASHFTARFGGATLDVHDGAPSRFDVQLAGGPSAWFPLLSRRATLKELEAAGALTRTGPARTAAAFVRSVGARV